MGSSQEEQVAGHDQETEHDHDHSWFDSKFAKLAGDIDNMGKELERLARMYDIHDWDEAALKLKHGLNGLSGLQEFKERLNTSTPKKLSSIRNVPDHTVLNDSSSSLVNSEENSNMSFCGNFPAHLYDGDSNSSFNLNDSFIDKMNNGVKEAKKQKLIIKLKRITKKYFMVGKLHIKDYKMKKHFLDYEQDRYYFQVYVNDLPKTYQCKQCPKIFNKITSLQFHKRTHTKMPQGKCESKRQLKIISPKLFLGYNIGDFARRFSNHANPVEPYIPAAHNKLTEHLVPHPTHYPGYISLDTTVLPSLRPGTSVRYGEDSFSVGEMIGEGGFARVYGAVWENGPLEERDTVLKIQSPANDWEWYILNQVTTNNLRPDESNNNISVEMEI